MQFIKYLATAALFLAVFNLENAAQITRGATVKADENQIRLKGIALVIGNGNYQKVRKLNNPVNDAADMTAALKELGFDVISGTDLSKSEMQDLIRRFSSRLTETKAVGVFFYAGHGLSVNDTNYLLPVDADVKEALDLKYAAVDINFLLDKLSAAQNGSNILILDACRNNPFAAQKNSPEKQSVGNLTKISVPTGTLIAYATKPGETALDGNNGTRNGLYTASILRQIRVRGISAAKLFQNVRAEVVSFSDGKQVPYDESSLLSDFFFAGNLSSGETNSQNSQNPFVLPPIKPLPMDGNNPLLLAYQFYQRGIEKIGKSDFDGAIGELTRAIGANPQFQDAYLVRGNLYNDIKGEFDSAIRDYSKVVEINPQYFQAYNNRGLVYQKLKNFDASISDFTAALKISPQYHDALFNRGGSYYSKQNYDAAIGDLTEVIRIYPQHFNALIVRGAIFGIHKKDFEAAIRDFTAAISILPAAPMPYKARADAYDQAGKPDLAEADRRKYKQLGGM